VIDKWFDNQVKPRMLGKAHMVRWADDIILIFQKEEDARRVHNVLPKRFAKYGLTIHPDKTRITEFRQPGRSDRTGKGNFDYLGFTHYWCKSRKGNWVIKRKTASKSLQRSLRAIMQWCRENRHETIRDQHQALKLKLKGHYQYYGITSNFRCLVGFLYSVKRIWQKWLNRRSQKKSLKWDGYARILELNPLPKPRITHSYLRASPTT
jgi:RNA-directed DNA polymerase